MKRLRRGKAFFEFFRRNENQEDDEYKQRLEQSVIEKILDSNVSYDSRRGVWTPYDRTLLNNDERLTFQDNWNGAK